MAEFLPFKGVLYNPKLIDDMSNVVTPPYDVISPKEQEAYYQKSPYNIVRLILGKSEPGDSSHSDIHKRASQYFQNWMNSQILVQDDVPAFYLTSVTFSSSHGANTRYGIIGRVRIEPFEKGIILPHERTFSKVKTERLQLMQACHTNFSPIFGLYADDNGILKALVEVTERQTPNMNFLDNTGLRHKLWRILSSEVQGHLTFALKKQSLYIADGHHRYETALNYRNWMRENSTDFDDSHPANFVMMSLSSLKDPGMVIFPAHRLLKDVPVEICDIFLEKLKSYFDLISFSTDSGLNQALDKFDSCMATHADRHAIGLFMKGCPSLNILLLKDGVMAEIFADEIPESLRDLDVTILTRLLMMELLRFNQARLDDATKIEYTTTTQNAVNAVLKKQADVAFILNPTRIEQVQRVSQEGLIMPRKSTYFFPKVGSGMVINVLNR